MSTAHDDEGSLAVLYNATVKAPRLLAMASFHLDFVDVTRQLMGNACIDLYNDLVHTLRMSENATLVQERGSNLLSFLKGLDAWLDDAKTGGETTGARDAMAFNARIWGIQSDLNDYAARAWSGLVKPYYGKRRQIFVDVLVTAKKQEAGLDAVAVQKTINAFEGS
ncbi:hypothetical protein LLEC1_00316 [Akanthomyces lecanii]|uniref:Alpha-N-acetylglucosaminidase C-terminal domain-containing protein n=1 Tax=Cordyceps confragosa TaxID=2714763 RepID=A0A179IL52_CORDF|nr:hypothetical protein LLEC1_00316 [Akanthomyces lecanii]